MIVLLITVILVAIYFPVVLVFVGVLLEGKDDCCFTTGFWFDDCLEREVDFSAALSGSDNTFTYCP